MECSKKKTELFCKKCGATIGFHEGKEMGKLLSSEYTRVDGSRPAFREYFNEKCPKCGKKVTHQSGLGRRPENGVL